MTRRWVVVLSEDIHPVGRTFLEQYADVRVASAPDEEALLDAARGADAIILRARGRVGASLMDRALRLRVVGRHGVGVDNVDVVAATARGIQVVNVPDANVTSVAEHVLALTLSLARHIKQADSAVRAGDWAQRDRDLGQELTGGTLGVVGFGRIGRTVARMFRAAFDLTVLYTDIAPDIHVDETLQARRTRLDELLRASDIVTLHVPLVPSTENLIGASQLALMRPSALLINTSRGGIVNERALAEALQAGVLGGAALDVFTEEPVHSDHPLLACDRAILTPHSAAMTEQASRRMARVAEDVIAVLDGGEPRHPVNQLAPGQRRR